MPPNILLKKILRSVWDFINSDYKLKLRKTKTSKNIPENNLFTLCITFILILIRKPELEAIKNEFILSFLCQIHLLCI